MTTDDLKKYDFHVFVDMSGSMGDPVSESNPQSRWESAQESVIALARTFQTYDDDGISVHFFNGGIKSYENVTNGQGIVEQLFKENRPMGTTDTAGALGKVINGYLGVRKNAGAKPIICVVITDGIPNNEQDLRNVIINATKEITTREEIGIVFVQVGKDAHAARFLDELDNNLQNEGAALDIVSAHSMAQLEDGSVSVDQLVIDSLTA